MTAREIVRIVATGYGRKSVAIADKAVTEIMCHAAGARFLDPSVRSLIDIGGQDSKAVVMDENGRVTNFAMNDKCAAGTGRFLEVMARALEADLDEFGELSLKAERPAKISSLCTVFAESEVISLIAKGETRENIIAGIHEAIASRVSAMASRIGLAAPVMMTGGWPGTSGSSGRSRRCSGCRSSSRPTPRLPAPSARRPSPGKKNRGRNTFAGARIFFDHASSPAAAGMGGRILLYKEGSPEVIDG